MIFFVYLLIGMATRGGIKYREDLVGVDAVKKELHSSDGRMVGYYIPEGYDHRNCYINIGRGEYPSKAAIDRHLVSLAQMNRDEDPQELIVVAKQYLREKDVTHFSYDEDFVLNKIDWAQHHEEELYFVTKKYYFNIPLSRDEVLSIVQKNGASERRAKTIALLEGALDQIKFDRVFATATNLSEYSGVKVATVRNYVGVFMDEITQYHMDIFGTTSYNEHIKKEHLDLIRHISSQFNTKNKRKIAREANIHYNTVGRLWKEAFNR